MIPVLEINALNYPNLAENIWHAQMAGHPRTLTFGSNKKYNRKEAMTVRDEIFSGQIPRILSRDEYPFACTKEGGAASWVGHIPPRENSAQGGLIAALIKRYDLKEGDSFEVRVINYSKGKVR